MSQSEGQKMPTGNRLYKLGRNKKQRTEPKFSAVSEYLNTYIYIVECLLMIVLGYWSNMSKVKFISFIILKLIHSMYLWFIFYVLCFTNLCQIFTHMIRYIKKGLTNIFQYHTVSI